MTSIRSFILPLVAVAGLFAAPQESKAALTFDLSENMPNGFFGYSTRQVGAGQWTIGTAEYTPGASGTVALVDTGGDLTFTATNLLGFATITADLHLTNATTTNPYGLDAINELHFFYNFARSNPNVNVAMQFSRPATPNVFADISGLGVGNNQVLSFQGESNPDGLGGPLIANGETGILRFTFSAGAFSASSYSFAST